MNMKPVITAHKKNAKGFSLLEVLIALIVLSIGLLGIAGLQVTSKQTNFDAIQRTTATMLAQDIIERMRANPDQLAAYHNAGVGFTFTPASGITTAVTNCATATCTPANLALYDLYEWERAILGVAELSATNTNTGGLVSPTACISVPGGSPAGTISVAIAWRGLVKLTNPGIDACGSATGLYDDTGGDNAYRRVIVVHTYID